MQIFFMGIILFILEKYFWKNLEDNSSIFMQTIPILVQVQKILILNRDHFWLDDHVKDFYFSRWFERKFFGQSTAYYHVKIINVENSTFYIHFFFRFCSRPFTLTCGHESIHLCNNAIQTRYTNAERSNKLPPDNMWDNRTFINFLKEQGMGDKWHSLIYPTMKKCLISKLF